jgi:hypothetical protein
MNIPPSIEKITEMGAGDPFNIPSLTPTLKANSIVDIIKQNLNVSGGKAFDVGSAFYKISHDEKTLLKNIINLYSETLTKALLQLEVDDKQKDTIQEYTKNFFKNTEQQIEIFFTLIQSILNKNIIDVNEISCSILGYAIETIRRNS